MAMNNPHLAFHHFGLAVRRPDEARKFVSTLGYQLGDPVFDPAQNVHLQLCTHAIQPAVEIIWPGDATSPVDKLTNYHPAGVVYHVCYETDDLAAAIAGLQAAGLKPICISPAKAAPLFRGRPVSFHNIVGIGLVEILEPV
jgi:hypothetical protein